MDYTDHGSNSPLSGTATFLRGLEEREASGLADSNEGEPELLAASCDPCYQSAIIRSRTICCTIEFGPSVAR